MFQYFLLAFVRFYCIILVVFNLGICYHRGRGVDQDHKQAAEYCRLAAEQGDAEGQLYLGGCYDNGRGVDQDHKQAAEYYRLAAEQGYP